MSPTERVGQSGSPAHPILITEGAGTVALRLMDAKLREALGREGRVLKGRDAEALHDMRVAVRRMRVVLMLFGRHLDQMGARRLSRELRALGRALAETRDLDVMLASLPSHRGASHLLSALRSDRRRARRRMMRYLRGREYRSLKRRLRSFVSTEPPDGGSGLRDVAPLLVEARLARVWVRLERALRSPTVRRFHRLRIAVKRLRYALEFLESGLGPSASAAIISLRQAQELLGEIQDIEAAIALLGRLPPDTGARPLLRRKSQALARSMRSAPRKLSGMLGPRLGAEVSASLERMRAPRRDVAPHPASK